MRRLIAVLTAAVCVALPASASAGTLDQQQTDVSGGMAVIVVDPSSITQSLAQTFTAGSSGALDQVDLHLGRFDASTPGPLTVEIRDVVSTTGAPGTSVLASATLPGASVPVGVGGLVAVHFASPPTVTAGTKYAIVAYSGDSNAYVWGRGTGDRYAGGGNFASAASPPSTWFVAPSDLAFKTYVLTGPTGTGGSNESVVANAIAGD
jgi:hypothetical protein